MEFDIIPQIIIVFSAGVVVFILGKNIPKAKEDSNSFFLESKKEKEKFLYFYKRLIRRINREKYQEKVSSFWVWFEKVLRRLRIKFLRLDGKIVSTLNKIKEKNVENEIESGNRDWNQKFDGFKNCNISRRETENGSECADGQKNKESYDIKSDSNDSDLKTKEEVPVAFGIDNEEKDNKEGDENETQKNNLDIESKEKKGKEKEYIDLILKNPVDIKSYWKLGIVYSRRKNYKDAISCFRQITKIDATYTKAKKKIADLMERMRKKNDNKLK